MGFKDLFGKKIKEKETVKAIASSNDAAPPEAQQQRQQRQQQQQKEEEQQQSPAQEEAVITGDTADTTGTIITPEQRTKWSKTLLPTGAVGFFPLKAPFNLEFAAKGNSKLQYFLALTTVYLGHDLPLNAVTFDRREKYSSVLLHGTPKIQGDPIAYAGQEKAFRSPSLIVLPRADVSNGNFNHIERQTLDVSWSLETYCFSFPVPNRDDDASGAGPRPGPGGAYRVEKFEWRRKPGESEDKMIDRRLVRLRTSTADEEDIVCRWVGVPWWRKRESNVVGTMEFLGAASRGELGPKWALMAVMSNLRIVNEDMHFNEMGAVLKSGSTVAIKAASLAVKIGVEVAMNV